MNMNKNVLEHMDKAAYIILLCIAAIALETLSAAVAALTAHGLAAEVTQIAVSRTKTAGSLHLLVANNPVFLIMGART